MAGAHGMVWKSTSAFFNEVVRVPLIIRFPSAIKPAKFEVPVSLVDLMPTILDFTGFSVPESCQGHSLVNLLSGKEKEEDHYQYAFCERIGANKSNVRKMNEGWKGAFMVMDKKGKYIEYPDGTRFFYNLVKDPYETVNEYNNQEYSAEISRYNKELKEWLTRTIQ
jgi:choline-sulfatase